MANNNYIDTTVRCSCGAFKGIRAERHEDGTDYKCTSCGRTWHSDADNGFRDYHEKRLVLQSKLIQLSHSRVSDGRKHINDSWRVVVTGDTAFYEHKDKHRRIDNEELNVLYKQVKALESEYPDFAQRDPIFGYMWIMLFTKGFQLFSNRIGEYSEQTNKTPYNVPGEVGYLKDYNARCEIAYNRRQADRQKEQDKKDQRNSPEAKKKRKAKAKAIIAISLVLVIAVTVVSLIYVLAPQVYFGTCTVEYYLDGERFTQDVAIKGNFSIEKPTKLGYRFLGFFADEDGKNQIVGADGNSVVKFDADKKNDSVKLYPIWEPIEYIIVFKPNGGRISGADNMKVEYGQTIGDLPTNVVRTGYIFKGWADKSGTLISDEDGKVYSDKKVLHESNHVIPKNEESEIVFTAVWEAETYTVTLDVNGGDALADDTISLTFGEKSTLPVPTKEGHDFVGWYNGDQKYTNETGALLSKWNVANNDTLLVARWEIASYEIEVQTDSAGGSVSGPSSADYNSSVQLTATTNPGYTWLGWYDGNTKVSEGNSMTYTFTMPAENKTYTAKWSKVTLATTPSDAGSVTSLTGKYNVGDEVTVTATTNDGYTWLGWYDGNTKVSEDLTYTFTMSAENKTYTAKWTYYTVSTETNIEEAGTYTAYLNHKVTVGNTVTLTATTNAGYTFNGWYMDGNLIYSGSVYDIHMPAEDIVIEAKWTPNVYSVSLDVNGGDALAEDAVSLTFGKTATLPVPTKEGHDFVGWYNGDQKYTDEDGVLLSKWNVANNDTLLTAKWEIATYIVTLDVNGGDALEQDTIRLTFGETATLPVPTKDHCVFVGWYDGTTQITDDNGTLLKEWEYTGNDECLVAHWQEIIVRISFSNCDSIGSETVNAGSSYELPTPTHGKYKYDTFLGWEWNGATYSGSFEVPDSDVALKACWASNGWTYIETAEQLDDVRNNMNGKYCLLNDIDISGVDWTPIGYDGTKYKAFSGVFDGDGHSIIGLYKRNTPAMVGVDAYMGLFAILDGAKVTHLKLENVDFCFGNTFKNPSYAYVGALAGRANNSEIDRVSVSGKVQGGWDNACAQDEYIGGLLGSANSTTIKYCSNKAMVLAYHYCVWAGGIVGFVQDPHVKILYCYNTGYIEIAHNGNGVSGGIVGLVNGSTATVRVTGCYAYCQIKNACGGWKDNIGGIVATATAEGNKSTVTDNYYCVQGLQSFSGNFTTVEREIWNVNKAGNRVDESTMLSGSQIGVLHAYSESNFSMNEGYCWVYGQGQPPKLYWEVE